MANITANDVANFYFTKINPNPQSEESTEEDLQEVVNKTVKSILKEMRLGKF